jgi:hypothetical protein
VVGVQDSWLDHVDEAGTCCLVLCLVSGCSIVVSSRNQVHSCVFLSV